MSSSIEWPQSFDWLFDYYKIVKEGLMPVLNKANNQWEWEKRDETLVEVVGTISTEQFSNRHSIEVDILFRDKLTKSPIMYYGSSKCVAVSTIIITKSPDNNVWYSLEYDEYHLREHEEIQTCDFPDIDLSTLNIIDEADFLPKP